MGIAEEGVEAEAGGELVMQGELRAVVEGDGAAQGARHAAEQAGQVTQDGACGLRGLPEDAGEAREAFVNDQDGLAGDAEQHEVGLPVARFGPGIGGDRPLADGHAGLDVADRAGASLAAWPAAVLAARQEAVPIVLLRGAMIDEAVDRLGTDDRATMQARQSAGDLLRRPPHRKEVTDLVPQSRLARQLVAPATVAPSFSQHHRPLGVIALSRPVPARQAITPKLAADCARMPAKYRGNLPLRSAGCMQPADRLPLCCTELLIMAPHRNTTLSGVLHLVRELKGSRVNDERLPWTPAFAGVTRERLGPRRTASC